ncbi:MAG: DUF4445 domain-containing protein [Desulfobacteraceae bacterium]|nr:MAG: DUF4445 domain-containing protein [Desulfobacteraceae bacterium]
MSGKEARMKIKVSFLPGGREAQVDEGVCLLEAARLAGVGLEGDCGGLGSCAKCRVIAHEGLAPPTVLEQERLDNQDIAQGMRLACQAQVKGPAQVTLLPSSTARHHILEEGVSRAVRLQPALTKHFLPLDVGDWKRSGPLAAMIRERLGREGVRRADFSVRALQSLGAIDPAGQEGLTALLFQNQVLGFEPGDTSGQLWGLAVDIGTTTVVGYLLDLTHGRIAAVASALNEQQIHGADVITRIDYALHHPQGLDRLRELVLSTINGIIERICQQQGLPDQAIYSLMVVGNTTINQLFWGIPPRLLIRPPYNPIAMEGLSASAKEMGLRINPLGMVFSLPLVSGFIGSDTVGVVLATGLHKSRKPRIALDIGTNGEIVLTDGHRMAACSCAAGPAFEGAHIQCGMRGCSGAIDRVDFKHGRIACHVIDEVPHQGICGSGLVDAVSGLLASGLITADGRLLTRQEAAGSPFADRLSEEPLTQFRLTEKMLPPASRQVVITQKDIRELQLAKGAMLAGVSILLDILDLGPEDIHEVLLAGAFGNYVRPRSALGIGLLPTFPRARIRQVGNAAGSGARMALLSQAAIKEAIRIAERIGHIDLARYPDFQHHFLKGLAFPHELARPDP